MMELQTLMEEITRETETELASMLDPLDIPGDWTERQRLAYEERRTALRSQIVERRASATERANANATLVSLDHELAETIRWRDFLIPTRKTLCDELLMPRTRSRADQEVQQILRYAIHTIDFGPKQLLGASVYTLRSTPLGELMIAAGYTPTDNPNHAVYSGLPWRGSLPEVEKTLLDLTSRRTVAQTQLVLASRSPEEVATAREERAKRPDRKTRGDGTQFDKYPDGTIVEVEPSPESGPVAEPEMPTA
ncbi:MAG: hypothetical protein ABJA98_32020 [Acidobacteriota bacterium]